MISAPKISSLKQGLKSSFSSSGVFSLARDKKNKTNSATRFQSQAQLQPQPQPQPQAQLQPQQPIGNVAQVLPQALGQATTLPASQSSKKETLISAYESPEKAPDFTEGVQAVEQEKSPEVPPEVESFLRRAEDNSAKLPEEIVIADNQKISKVTHYPKTPVLVLPITPEEEKSGKKKSPNFSIRWLVEWSYKMIKKFSGKVVYRIADQSNNESKF